MIDYNPTLSSSSLLSGDLGILDLIDHFYSTFTDSVATAADRAADLANADLISRAQVHEEWGALLPYLNVYFDGDGFVFGVQPEAAYAAMELEYGTPDSPPKPVLRSTAVSSSGTMSNYISSALSGSVPSA